MDIETIRRISLARQLYEFGVASLRSKNDLQLFAAVNLLQDAVEAFLIAVADHVKAEVDQNTKFDKYFVAINSKIAPKELPFKHKLLRLNRIRVDSKHHGIQPARDECDRVAVSVREFFDETAASVFGVDFATVSAIDLLTESPVKQLLQEARAARERGDLQSCVIACRKAVYVMVEENYDVSAFREGAPALTGLAALFGPRTDAPQYARNSRYIAENVRDPTDYVVRDHSRIDQELLKSGVDTTAFWNVWRLTPDVYRREGSWIVKHEFHKLSPDFLANTVDYVFPTAVDMALAMQQAQQSIQTGNYEKYTLVLRREGVPVFDKADNLSRVVATTPLGVTHLDTSYRVLGLRGDADYWLVFHLKDKFITGFIHDDEVSGME